MKTSAWLDKRTHLIKIRLFKFYIAHIKAIPIYIGSINKFNYIY